MAVEAQVLAPQHEDQRRTISETVIHDGPSVTRVTQIDIKGGRNVLGNHYHLGGVEQFHLVAGTGVVLLTQETTAWGTADGPVQQQVLSAPALVDIAPGVAHTFIFTGPGILISRNPGEFDPSDMHAYNLSD